MKKFYVLFCMIALTSVVSAQTTDRTLFGFKGEVIKAEIGSGNGTYSFDDDGNILDNLYLWDGIGNNSYNVSINKRTKSSLSGESNYGDFTATIANNHITKTVIKGTKNNYPSTYTCKYTYDKKGNLIKVNENFVYYVDEKIEYSGSVYGVSNYQAELNKIQNEYQRKLMNGASYDELERWYNNAVARLEKASRGIGVSANARVKKTKKELKTEYTYRDYEFDDFGNWISRTIEKDNNSYTQNQTIQYDPEFWSQFYWERLEKEGNLNKIDAFFCHPITTDTYKKLASKYWNERILDEVAQKYDNDLDSLCCVAGKAISSYLVKDQALGIVRKRMFEDVVMAERDYSRVLEMKSLQRQNVPVFDNNYRQRIEARSEKLKADSIAVLLNKAQMEFENADYKNSLATGKVILKIDPKNETAENLCQESHYRVIAAKEANNTVQESDYANFINDYSTSIYKQEMQNKRALYASSLFNETTSEEELERVLALPSDEPTHKTVNKLYKKWMFRKKRGQFFYWGPGFEFAMGPANSIMAAELTTRYGYTANLINATVGLKYNILTSTAHLLDSISGPGNAFFKCAYISAPIMLRINYGGDYESSSYIGIGGDLNWYTISAALKDVEDINDKNFANKLSFTPRIAWGGQILGLELELFASYDIENPFNVDYIKNYKLSNGQNIITICDEKAYEKQINGNGFINKVRAGVTARLLF